MSKRLSDPVSRKGSDYRIRAFYLQRVVFFDKNGYTKVHVKIQNLMLGSRY